MTIKFLTPFATDGDKSEIPSTIQSDGSISLPEGWGFDYSRNPSTDPLAKRIDRAAMNWLLYAITGALGQIQQTGAPEWISAVDNGGTAFEYEQGAIVRYDGVTYGSLAGINTATPGTDPTKWAILDLSLFAPLSSPAFTGTPTVPTAAPGTNTTQAASTAFVVAALAGISLTGYARLDTAQDWIRAQSCAPVALTDAGTIAWDLAVAQMAEVTIVDNRILGAPTNMRAGTRYELTVIHGAPNTTLSFAAAFTNVAGLALSTASGASDVLTFKCDGTHMALVSVASNVLGA